MILKLHLFSFKKRKKLHVSAAESSLPTNPIASRRSMDMDAESQLAEFLDENLYASLLNEGAFTHIHRERTKENQLLGIDVVVKTSSSSANIDEKAQLYYINKNLPTFAFELQFIKNGVSIDGWFINENLRTDYYLLIWPSARDEDVASIRKDDFTKVDALMISCKRIHKYLDGKGLTRDVLYSRALSLRKSGEVGKVPSGISGIYYYVSNPSRYAEAPINLVISKRILENIAQAHYDIRPGGFTRK